MRIRPSDKTLQTFTILPLAAGLFVFVTWETAGTLPFNIALPAISAPPFISERFYELTYMLGLQQGEVLSAVKIIAAVFAIACCGFLILDVRKAVLDVLYRMRNNQTPQLASGILRKGMHTR